MRPINRLTALGLPALLVLGACESSTAPEEGGLEESLSTVALQELDPSIDSELTGALIEDVRFTLETEATPQSALIADAEAAFAAAADAYASGDAATAQVKANDARVALGTAWMDGLGDAGLDELFERANHLKDWLSGENDCVADVDRVLRAINRLILQAENAQAAGHLRRAAASLILVGQIVDRACFDRDHDGDNFNKMARFAVARAHAAVRLAQRLQSDVLTDSQNRLLVRAMHLAEWAEKAYQNHNFRRAFVLARRAEITALRSVFDRDGVQEEEVRLIYEVAETLLAEAAAIEDPTEIQQRLVNMADRLFARGVEMLEAGNLRGVVSLWRSAITSMLAL